LEVNPEEIFKYRYEQLAKLVQGGKAVQLVDVAAILRQFLVDSPSIIDTVNRKYRLKITFEVFESTDEQIERLRSQDGMIPSFISLGTVLPPFAPLKPMTKDAFLGFNVLYVNGTHFNVRQIIKVCANRLGAIHLSSPASDNRDKAILRKLNEVWEFIGTPATFSMLILIGRIATKALVELNLKLTDSIRSTS
jgi:hypothetical protein